MGKTSNCNNRGIAHLSFQSGATPFCKSPNAMISVVVADRARWPRICKRCDAKAAKMAEASARRESRRVA